MHFYNILRAAFSIALEFLKFKSSKYIKLSKVTVMQQPFGLPTARKVSKCVNLRKPPYSARIQENAEQKKSHNWTLFTQ